MENIYRITLTIAAILCFSFSVSNAQTFDVIPVNVPEFNQCLGLNIRGQLPAYTLAGFGAGPRNPLLWSAGQTIPIANGLGEAQDINDSGLVVGWLGFHPVATTLNFSSDHRTRVMLFVTGLGVPVNPAIITAQAEDTQHHVQSLTVEHVGSVPNFEWITQVTVILPAALDGAGDVQVTVSSGGAPSNQALLNIK